MNYDEMKAHLGHSIEIVAYGKHGKPPWWNYSLECTTCDSVIEDHDTPGPVRLAIELDRSKKRTWAGECELCGGDLEPDVGLCPTCNKDEPYFATMRAEAAEER